MTNRVISSVSKILLMITSVGALSITASKDEVQTTYSIASQTTTTEARNMSEQIFLISDRVGFGTNLILSTSLSVFEEIIPSRSFEGRAVFDSLSLINFEAASSDTETILPDITLYSTIENSIIIGGSLSKTYEWSAMTDSFSSTSSLIITSAVEPTNAALDSSSISDIIDISMENSFSGTGSSLLSATDSSISSEFYLSIESSFTSTYEPLTPTLSPDLESTSSDTDSSEESRSQVTSTSVFPISPNDSLSLTSTLSSNSLDESEQMESSNFETRSSTSGIIDMTMSTFIYPSDSQAISTETELASDLQTQEIVSPSAVQSTDSFPSSTFLTSPIRTISEDFTSIMIESYSIESVSDYFSTSNPESFSFVSNTDIISPIKSSLSDVTSHTDSIIESSSKSLIPPELSLAISDVESSTESFSSVETTQTTMESEIVPSTSMVASSSDSPSSSITSQVPPVSVTTDSSITSTSSSSTTQSTSPNFVYPVESPNVDAISFVFSFELTVSRNFSDVEDTDDQKDFMITLTDMLTEFVFVNIKAEFNITLREGSIIATVEATIEASTLAEVGLTFPETVTNITMNFVSNQEHIENVFPDIDFNSSFDSLKEAEEQVLIDPCLFVTTTKACSPSYTFQCVDGIKDECVHRCVDAGNQCGGNGVCFYDFTLNATACRCITDSYRVYHGSNCEESTATLSFVLALSLGIGCGLLFLCCLIIIALVFQKRREQKNSGDLNRSAKRKQYSRDSARSNDAYYNGEYIPTMTGDTLSTFKYGPSDGYPNEIYRESTPL